MTLEPGDVLYVPKHWWHFVEAVDTSLSVNVWVDAPDDAEDRAKEALARVLVTSLSGSLDAEVKTNGRKIVYIIARKCCRLLCYGNSSFFYLVVHSLNTPYLRRTPCQGPNRLFLPGRTLRHQLILRRFFSRVFAMLNRSAQAG